MTVSTKAITLGFVPARRGGFPTDLAASMRSETIAAIERAGMTVVAPDVQQTAGGCVESRREAELCGRLFRDRDVDGIVVGAMNFGNEQAAAETVRRAGLDVPVLLFGGQEEETLTPNTPRRDSFCGLLSIAEALRQIGVRYSVGQTPVGFPRSPEFAKDLSWFAAVCRVVGGIRSARYGQVGTRPDPFWTCRFDEKRLQRLGPTTVVVDLSEVIARANELRDDDPEVAKIVGAIGQYADTSGISKEALHKSAKLELVLRRWKEDNGLDALAIQCWTSIQMNLGVCACTTMSRLGDDGAPSACESDILGTLSMHALQLSSGTPAALADWNNLHNDDPDLVNLWHCGVFPKSFTRSRPQLRVHGVVAANNPEAADSFHGVVELVADPSPVTLARVTQDPEGEWKVLVVEGRVEANPAATYGSYGWCRIPGLQRLYRDVLLRHFPHHVALTQGLTGDVLREAFGNYLGLPVYPA